MIAGHLRIIKETYYMILSYNNSDNKRTSVTINTNIKERGGKKRAREMLKEYQENFDILIYERTGSKLLKEEAKKIKKIGRKKIGYELDYNDILFVDFLNSFLEDHNKEIASSTSISYKYCLGNVTIPYFEPEGLYLKQVEYKDINKFYDFCKSKRKVSDNTIIHYHAYLSSAFNYALKKQLIEINPMYLVTRPKKTKFITDVYEDKEVNKLLNYADESTIKLPIYLAIYYGLRRSEIVGLKWSAVNFEKNTITVRHTVVRGIVDGKQICIGRDETKTKSSYRTFPLMENIKKLLVDARNEQIRNKLMLQSGYIDQYGEYINVYESGELMKPDYITKHFALLLKNNGLRKVRFHDLRHVCASKLLDAGISLKEIQEWLGHSDISTTANVYTHLSYKSKLNAASKIEDAFI
jgi:integrase